MNNRLEGTLWTADPDATLQSLLNDPACPGLLARVLTSIHSWQVRNETTVGRTLRASQLMPQWTAALLALGAVVTIEGEDGREDVELKAFIGQRTAGDVVGLRVPRQENVQWGEAHLSRTPSDDPIVAALAVVKQSDNVVEEARIALTGVSSEPVYIFDASRQLREQRLDQDWITDVVSAVINEVEPVGDYLGSEDYRRAMAGVMTRRALKDCLLSASAGGER